MSDFRYSSEAGPVQEHLSNPGRHRCPGHHSKANASSALVSRRRRGSSTSCSYSAWIRLRCRYPCTPWAIPIARDAASARAIPPVSASAGPVRSRKGVAAPIAMIKGKITKTLKHPDRYPVLFRGAAFCRRPYVPLDLFTNVRFPVVEVFTTRRLVTAEKIPALLILSAI